MSVVTEIRKSVSEASPVMAVVGATDLAVERVRKAAAEAGERSSELSTEWEGRVTKIQMDIEKAVGSLDPDYLQQVPAFAVSRALEVAGKVETGYESLAARGRRLLSRVEGDKATQELVRQGKATLARGKAAATSASRSVESTVDSARATLTIGRQEVAETAGDVVEAVTEGAEATAEAVATEVTTGTKGTREGVKRTATTARKRAATTRSTAKGAGTSTAKTAKAASAAAKSAAEKVGD